MEFEGDAFISYAHLDNVELVEGRKGWVANLHRALEVRVGQLLGKKPQIWRDPKLAGNDSLEETLFERLRRVAILISVVSPRYVRSEWSLKELAEFVRVAQEKGGLLVREKTRVFKVLKTPVPWDQTPPELRSLLGYEFFKIDRETGRIRELDEIFGPEAQRDFWIKLDDLAHDICGLLQMLEAPNAPAAVPAAPPGPSVFLAETTSDLKEQRESLKRDLQQKGCLVLPDRALPLTAPEIAASIQEDLARCRLSIHLIGNSYSFVPEGGRESLLEMQNELAIARGRLGSFSRLLWIPPGMKVDDERQQQVIERLRLDPRMQSAADLLETFFEDLRTVIHDLLNRMEAPAPDRAGAPASAVEGLRRLYVICDQRDTEAINPWVEGLFDQQLEVTQQLFEGDEGEVREYHEENLTTCDGVLIFFGSGSECWLRRKLREIQKAAGYGRSKPQPPVAICLVPPRTGEKERFRTHEALVVPQWDGYALDPLGPFLARLKGGVV